MNIKTKYLLSLLFICFSSTTSAMEVLINQQQIQGAIALLFPYPAKLGSWNIVLDHPKLSLFEKTQSVSLQSEIHAKEGKKEILMTGQIKGKVHFNAVKQELQLINPTLEKLVITKTNIPEASKIVKQISTGFGKALPIIVLLNLNQMGISSPLFKPTQINIVHKGLMIGL